MVNAYVRRLPPHNLMINPPIQSTKTTRKNVLRKFLDFTSLPAERVDDSVRGRSGVGARYCLRAVSCERPLSSSIADDLAPSTVLNGSSTEVLVLGPLGVAGWTMELGP